MTNEIPAGSNAEVVCQVHGVGHVYGEKIALRDVDLEVHRGEIVSLLGPNGSGKTTLFRLLCTIMGVQKGTIVIDGVDAAKDPLGIRQRIGIVFQSPSLDKRLTVDENIECQGALYGLRGETLDRRRDEVLEQMGLVDRRGDYCKSLSGGQKRRVELAKGILHRPSLLLLDEPSTGLDPSARLNLWSILRQLAAAGTAILMTTHILDEAEKSDRVAILADGKKIADNPPDQLRSELGDGLITIQAKNVDLVEQWIRNDLGLETQRVHDQLRIRGESPAKLVPILVERLGDEAHSISFGRPNLEDVFIAKTGRQFLEVSSP
jgi:ABC-2 type transport system ATP-binding protein